MFLIVNLILQFIRHNLPSNSPHLYYSPFPAVLVPAFPRLSADLALWLCHSGLCYASPLLLLCSPIRLFPPLLFCFLNPESLPLMFCSPCSLGIHHLLVLQDLCSRYFTLKISLSPLQLLAGLGSTVCKSDFHLQVSALYAQGRREGIGFYFKTLFGSNKNS